ncbi:MAG: HAD family hydrolase [Pseudomonadota bacterium]
MTRFDTYQALSFDCYGTLIDWEAGISSWAEGWIARTDATMSAQDFVAAFGRHERNVQSETPELRYPLILAEVLRRIAAEKDVTVSDDDAESFGASVGNWPAFEDSTTSLRVLAERYKLIILSNVDRSSFARSNERLGVRFDAVITAEDVGAYKPSTKSFDTLLATVDGMGVPKHALLHVGESYHHDIEPAVRDGIDVVWIDRGRSTGRPRASGAIGTDAEPLATYESMSEFARAALNGNVG